MTNPAQDVRRQVKVARSALDLTQQQLARRAHVSRGSVQNLENGMRLDETTESKIEAALGKPAGWIDTVRAGHASDPAVSDASHGRIVAARVDPETGTVGDLRRELAYFHHRLTREDYDRLLTLLDLYYRLELPGRSTQGGLDATAQS